jgi:molybdate transport system regulatory protein
MLRNTGARLGEVFLVNDQEDIDFRRSEVRLVTLKRHKHKRPTRLVPVLKDVATEVATYLAEFPEMKGNVYRPTRETSEGSFTNEAEKQGSRKSSATHTSSDTPGQLSF